MTAAFTVNKKGGADSCTWQFLDGITEIGGNYGANDHKYRTVGNVSMCPGGSAGEVRA